MTIRTQVERSEKSRQQILDAALELFSHKGYGATSVQDIATAAGISKGNLYHHFPEKETIFRALLDRYFAALSDPEFPFNRALATGTFPENLEDLGRAARDMVSEYREYVTLIYVDVVEFEASHVRKFYAEMANRFDAFIKAQGMEKELEGKLAEGLSPRSAMMLATRVFFNYYSVEIVFGVRDHFGRKSDVALNEITRILRHGMLRNDVAPVARTTGAKKVANRSRGAKAKR
ncbi:MAG TPA: TetR/AcrR family transcriptional regulator [Rhodothermales bacterium]|nr:TetR/AcrR family transcriptional regulator [Rhodothermales bacterium]